MQKLNQLQVNFSKDSEQADLLNFLTQPGKLTKLRVLRAKISMTVLSFELLVNLLVQTQSTIETLEIRCDELTDCLAGHTTCAIEKLFEHSDLCGQYSVSV